MENEKELHIIITWGIRVAQKAQQTDIHKWCKKYNNKKKTHNQIFLNYMDFL